MTGSLADTICAVSTAPGVGGIAVVRVSGPDSIAVVDKVWQGQCLAQVATHTAHFGIIRDPESGEVLDEAVATVFRAPRSFTGDDVVELGVHGSLWIQQELVRLLIRNGARMAGPGEFTRRAFAAGKIDLAQAEGVADMIACTSRAAHRLAVTQMRGQLSRRLGELRDSLIELGALLELELDFSEEDVEFASRTRLLDLSTTIHAEIGRLTASFASGSAIKNGIPVAIVGATNVGKSTILNRLLRDDKAIVSDIPGTTRDTVEDTVEINGVLYRFIDTAGLRETTDTVETLGIGRALDSMRRATVILYVVDATTGPRDEWSKIVEAVTEEQHLIIVVNKTDMSAAWSVPDTAKAEAVVTMSARNNSDITDLERALVEAIGLADSAETLMITNARHYEELTRAGESISRVIDGLTSGLPGDLIAQDLRETARHLGSITGAVTPDLLLSSIFSRFCIGK